MTDCRKCELSNDCPGFYDCPKITTEHSKPIESGERADMIQALHDIASDRTTGLLFDQIKTILKAAEMLIADDEILDIQAGSIEAVQAANARLSADDKAGAYTKALEIRTEQGWNLTGEAIPVLYTDTINGQQVCRDDVWLCTTAALRKEDDKAGWEAIGEGFFLPDGTFTGSATAGFGYLRPTPNDAAAGCTVRKLYTRPQPQADQSAEQCRREPSGPNEYVCDCKPGECTAVQPAERMKCDGNHGGPRCADPECWNDEAAEQR